MMKGHEHAICTDLELLPESTSCKLRSESFRAGLKIATKTHHPRIVENEGKKLHDLEIRDLWQQDPID